MFVFNVSPDFCIFLAAFNFSVRFSPNRYLSLLVSISAPFKLLLMEAMTKLRRVFVSKLWLSQSKRLASPIGLSNFSLEKLFDNSISVTCANAANAAAKYFCFDCKEKSRLTRASGRAAFASGFSKGGTNKSQLPGIKYSLTNLSLISLDRPLAKISCHLEASSLCIFSPKAVSGFGASPRRVKIDSSSSSGTETGAADAEEGPG